MGIYQAEEEPHSISILSPHGAVELLVGNTVEDIERELILHTLTRVEGNRTRAAKMLGVSVRTMRNKISTYLAHGVNVPR